MALEDEVKAVDSAIQELEDQGITLQTYIQKEPEGLGDTVANVLAKFGITEESIGRVLGVSGCGCSKRRQFLNRIFPYKNRAKNQNA